MATPVLSRGNGHGGAECGCLACETRFATLETIISGFNVCGCVVIEGVSYKIDSFTGITGGSTQTFPGGTIGLVNIQHYSDDGCNTPIGEPIPSTVSLNLSCLGDRIYPTITIPDFSPGSASDVFSSAAGGIIGEIIMNDLSCAGKFGTVDSIQFFLP